MTTPIRLFAAAAVMIGTTFAFTPNEQQENAIENISQVVAGSRICDDWELNEKLAAAIQIAFGFHITDQATFNYIDERVTYHLERIKDRPRESICDSMERLYGPEGTNAAGLALRVKK